MSKAKIRRDNEGRFYGIQILCKGCTYMDGSPMTHTLPVNWLPEGEDAASPYVKNYDKWSFNGDLENPVFGPSLKMSWGGTTHKKADSTDHTVPLHVCHSFIGCNGAEPGYIIYLGDCTHTLKNQVVKLPDFPLTEEQD